jgi:hypothetical protein
MTVHIYLIKVILMKTVAIPVQSQNIIINTRVLFYNFYRVPRFIIFIYITREAHMLNHVFIDHLICDNE